MEEPARRATLGAHPNPDANPNHNPDANPNHNPNANPNPNPNPHPHPDPHPHPHPHPTPTPSQVRRVWAVSDIHVEHKDNWSWLSNLVPQPEDALVVPSP